MRKLILWQVAKGAVYKIGRKTGKGNNIIAGQIVIKLTKLMNDYSNLFEKTTKTKKAVFFYARALSLLLSSHFKHSIFCISKFFEIKIEKFYRI